MNVLIKLLLALNFIILIFIIKSMFFLDNSNKYIIDVHQKDALRNSKCLFHDLVYKSDENQVNKYLSPTRKHSKIKYGSCGKDISFQKVISQEKYRIYLDFDLLSNLTKTRRQHIQCYTHKFDKIMDVSEQNKKIQMIKPIYYFNSSEIKLSTYGFFYLICENKVNNSKIFDQVLTVYPEDMAQLISDRKKYITPNQSSVNKLPTLDYSKQDKMNVLIIGIDSLSAKHFRRIFPLTLEYLSSLENNVIFDHFNSLGGTTFPNILAMLSAVIAVNINDSLKSEIGEYKNKYSTFYDHIPFLWYDYEKNGYVTMFQEDDPVIAIFNYLKKGFKQWPTNLYGRPFWLKYYATRNGPNKCHFNYPTYFTWFDMMKNFLTAIKNSSKKIPFFSFNYLTEYTHNYFAVPEKMDQHLTDFLKQLVLDDTLFIFFTDHGNKLVPYSYKTEMGRMEKFLPFLSIKVPNKMKNSVYYENLKKNKQKLISFFDIFQTLRQFLFINNHGTTVGYENEFSNNSIDQREKRGMSLFENVHLNRSCDEAYIPEKLCPCLKYADIDETVLKSETKFNYKMMSEFVLDHVVSKTNIIRSKCEKYKFEKLIKIQKANTINKLLYRIVYVLQPGDAWFESFVNYFNNKFVFSSETVRLSAYGNQPFCIDDTNLKQFCFCL